MRALFTQLKQSTFVRHNTVFFIGTIAVAFFNYLYHPILSRMLSLEDFGEVQTIFSLSVQIGIILNVLGMVALNIVANTAGDEEHKSLLRNLQSLAVYGIAGLSLILLFFSRSLEAGFQFKDPLPFFILVALLITTVPVTFRKSFLQAKHDFAAVSYSGIIQAAGRLVFAVGLVLVGLGTFGALGALVVAQALSLIYLYSKTSGEHALRLTLRPRLTRSLTRELRYILLTLLGVGFVAFLTSADILFAKYYFDPATAGAYSGISTVARIIFFATSSIAAVLLPSIKLEHSFNEHSTIFIKSLGLLLAIGLSGLFIFTLFPAHIISILIGHKFISAAALLPKLAVVTFVASIVNLGVYYFLALRVYSLLGALAIGTVATALPIYINHSSTMDIVNGFMWGSCTTLGSLILLFMYVWYTRTRASSDH